MIIFTSKISFIWKCFIVFLLYSYFCSKAVSQPLKLNCYPLISFSFHFIAFCLFLDFLNTTLFLFSFWCHSAKENTCTFSSCLHYNQKIPKIIEVLDIWSTTIKEDFFALFFKYWQRWGVAFQVKLKNDQLVIRISMWMGRKQSLLSSGMNITLLKK